MPAGSHKTRLTALNVCLLLPNFSEIHPLPQGYLAELCCYLDDTHETGAYHGSVLPHAFGSRYLSTTTSFLV